MGMELDEWKYESCRGIFATGPVWATLYIIESGEENKGHAQVLLKNAVGYYRSKKLVVGGTVALHPAMTHLYKKYNIKEYGQ